MSKEIEKRFKNFDYKTIKALFEKNGVKKAGGELFKISSFFPVRENQMIRTRTEGDTVTMTIKTKKPGEYDTEWEVKISNQEMMDNILEQLNIRKKYTLYKFREMYETKNGDTKIIFDHFPGLPPYMEVESDTEEQLRATISMLDLKEEEHFTAKGLYYDHYGIPTNRKDEDLSFENAYEKLESYITKNRDKFIEILNHQQEFLKKKIKE